jgi:hypothetical protein
MKNPKLPIVEYNPLAKLAEIEGTSVEERLEQGVLDGVVKGICTNPGCEYTTDVEPDQDRGWCEACNTNTVKSALVLAGII